MLRSLGVAAVLLGACGLQQASVPDGLDVSGTSATIAVEPGDTGNSGDTSFDQLSLVAIGSLDQPVDVAARANDDTLYFVSRSGTIHQFSNGKFAASPVLDISGLTTGAGERGLLGLAFSNDGATAFLNYTALNGDTTIAAVTINDQGVFVRESLRTILTIEQPFRNHNAGDLVVEPSGTLLVAMGDGGSADDPLRTSLDDSSLLGKVLRVNPIDGSVTTLAKGLRNPWRIDLYDDRLWLADVGQNKWEEVSVLDAVSQVAMVVDFGWSAFEANTRFNSDQKSPAHVAPIVAYEHGDDGCSVSGGAVATTGALRGRYVFADYCSGRIWSIATDIASPTMTRHFDGVESPVAVARAGDEVFILSLGGTIWKLNG